MTLTPKHPWVITGLDPVSAEFVAGLPYADQRAELPDEEADPVVLVGPLSQIGRSTRIDPGEGFPPSTIDLDLLPLDKDNTWVGPPAASSDDARDLVVRGGDSPRSDVARTRLSGQCHAVEFGGRGAGDPRTTEQLVELGRAARAVLLDVSTFSHPVYAARLLLQLCASGVPCGVAGSDQLPSLDGWVEQELVDTIGQVQPDGSLIRSRSLAARQKTLAWMLHDRVLDWAELAAGWRPVVRNRSPARVSVLLGTKRPRAVLDALPMVARQRFVDVEVVLIAHGFDATECEQAVAVMRDCGLQGTALRVPFEVPFGAALNLGAQQAGGDLLCKWDDDDLYGPFHLADLVTARLTSGASLVGKYAEFIYLEAEDETIWRHPRGSETASPSIAGGTLMIDRSSFEDVGGFPPIRRAVDHHLRTRVHERGFGAFRTHGFGYVLVRHGRGHTWSVTNERLRGTSVESFQGIPSVLHAGAGDASGRSHA